MTNSNTTETASRNKETAREADPTNKSLISVVFLGVLAGLQLIDPAVANTALVPAARDLGMQGSAFALASSISTLALAATVLPFGMLADRLGRRKIILVALIITIIGDVIVALSPVTAGYFAGRAIAGIGVGAVLAASFAYVRYVSKPEKLGANLGLWNLALIVVFIVGSVLGGVLANTHWRLAMLLVPALAAICFFLTPMILPSMPKVPGGKPDYLGMTTIALAMIAFLYGIAQVSHGLGAPQFFIPTIAGLLLFALYYWVETKVENPIFPPRLFASGIFAAAIVAGIAWNFAQGAVQLQTSNFWQYVQHYSTGEVASGQLIFMIAYGVFGVIAGKAMAPGMRAAKLIGFGFIVLTVGFLLFGFVKPNTGLGLFLPLLFFMGIGLAFTSVPQSVLFVSVAPAKYFGPVTSFRTTAGQLGYALGFAVSTGLLSAFATAELRERLSNNGVAQSQMQNPMQQVIDFVTKGTQPTLSEAQAQIGTALNDYAYGFDAMMIICGIFLAFLGAITILLLVIGNKQIKEGQDFSGD
ncbi:MAG: MFS transporter [Candidatus Nanopelagicales bacterium]